MSNSYLAELREKSVDELHEAKSKLLEKQFQLRIVHSSGDLTKTSELKQVKVNIARVNTIIREKVGQ